MRVKLIEDLPMATSAELYQLSWVIEQLMADPRRIVQARQQLHLGQMVQFWEWGTGKLRPARIVSMKDSQVTLLDEQSQHRISVSYAAIVLGDEKAGTAGRPRPVQQPTHRCSRHLRSIAKKTSALVRRSASLTRA